MSPVPNHPSKTGSVQSLSTDAEPLDTNPEGADGGESPRLMRPIARPPAPEPLPEAEATPEAAEPEELDLVQRPIPAPSEPMQYRAIGLVRGIYTASEEQFTRGVMKTDDGSEVEAVLLGRVMSLVKNHLALDKEHLWVVYPRTRDREGTLHLQIVGVWEPENLSQSGEETDTETVYQPASEVEGNQFSIRGEIIFYSEEEKKTVVKIKQVVRKKQETEEKSFKLNLEGELPGHKTIGYFWDLDVKRVDQALTIQGGNVIAIVPPQKNPKKRRRFGGGGAGARRPGGRPNGARPRPQGGSGAPKPVKKRDRSATETSAPATTSEATS